MGRGYRMWDAGGREILRRSCGLLCVGCRTAGNDYLCRAYDAVMQFVTLLRHHHHVPGGHFSRWLLQNGLMEIWVKHFILGRNRYTFVPVQERVQLLFDQSETGKE